MRASKAMLIDEFMPEYDAVETHSLDLRAPSKSVYTAVKALDLTDSRIVSVLFKLRETASVFSFEKKRQGGLGLTLDGLLKSGFILLGERPDEEILLGVAG